jgi:hypothetical protein
MSARWRRRPRNSAPRSRRSGARRLDRGVERQEVGLGGDRRDEPDHVADAVHRRGGLVECRHGGGGGRGTRRLGPGDRPPGRRLGRPRPHRRRPDHVADAVHRQAEVAHHPGGRAGLRGGGAGEAGRSCRSPPGRCPRPRPGPPRNRPPWPPPPRRPRRMSADEPDHVADAVHRQAEVAHHPGGRAGLRGGGAGEGSPPGRCPRPRPGPPRNRPPWPPPPRRPRRMSARDAVHRQAEVAHHPGGRAGLRGGGAGEAGRAVDLAADLLDRGAEFLGRRRHRADIRRGLLGGGWR